MCDLGLDRDRLRFGRTTQGWLDAGERLRDELSGQLRNSIAGVEHIGSSSVVGLLAKPIIDLVIGLGPDHPVSPVREKLESTGWIYRGDAGAHGGHLFVLETRPWHRVAHIHIVVHGGEQWRNYVRLRELLRLSASARERYESVKLRLADEVGDDRVAYTEGKSSVITSLLDSP